MSAQTVDHSGKIIRAVRKYYGITQDELTNILGIPQPTLSKIETGVSELGALHWSQFCQRYNVDYSSLLTGYAELDIKSPALDSERSAGDFKIPTRYSHLKGSSVRTAIPFINYAKEMFGEKYIFDFIRKLGFSLDYFTILNNPLNINFVYDLSDAMMNKGSLPVKDVASLPENKKMHGILERGYYKSKDGKEFVSRLIKTVKRYEVNFQYDILEETDDELTVSIKPNEHMKEFMSDNNRKIEKMLKTYRPHIIQSAVSHLNLERGTLKIDKVEENECLFHLAY